MIFEHISAYLMTHDILAEYTYPEWMGLALNMNLYGLPRLVVAYWNRNARTVLKWKTIFLCLKAFSFVFYNIFRCIFFKLAGIV